MCSAKTATPGQHLDSATGRAFAGGSLPAIGLVYPLEHGGAAAMLRERAQISVADAPTEPAIADLVRTVDGLIARGPAQVTAEHVRCAPNLRVIVATGSGTNHIDVGAATERGIPVICGAGVAPHSVAEYTVGALIACQRNLVGFHVALSSGEYPWPSRLVAGNARPSIFGSTVGLVGFGYIAQCVADMLVRAFGAEILAYDPYAGPITQPGVTCVESLEELFVRSSAVSVHVPLTDSTRGMIGEEELRRIGPRGCLVNTSRGGVVDETALIDVLTSGELGSACIDVFEHEPPGPAALGALAATPNLIITPHVAGITDTARQSLETAAVVEVLRAIAGDRPERVVNPEVFDERTSTPEPA